MSTERQASEGLGLDVQLAACRAWCRTNDRPRPLVFVDEGVSGTGDALDRRQGLAAALAAIRGGRVDELLVYRLDRLARDMVLQEQLFAEVSRAGGALRSTSAAEDAYLVDDPTDPARALVRHVLGAVSQYERALIALRLAAGRDRKRAAGGYAGGMPPLGFRAQGGELVVDAELAPVIATIRRRRRQGASLRTIAAELGPRPDGRPWHPQTLARILARAVQSG